MNGTPIRIASICEATIFYLPLTLRTELAFGGERVTEIECCRVKVEVESGDGGRFRGWGEVPISVNWVWPSGLPYAVRRERLRDLTQLIADSFVRFRGTGHALEIGTEFVDLGLPRVLADFNAAHPRSEAVPRLASLLCFAPFDIAMHDAFGHLAGLPTYATYGPDHLGHDLAHVLGNDFIGEYPGSWLVRSPASRLQAWHLVGASDLLTRESTHHVDPATLPVDGYPVSLDEWIERDGLRCLKIKLKGADAEWDYERIVSVARLALPLGARTLSVDFNCTVHDPSYVVEILDRLRIDEPDAFASILYVEQPFPYDLESNQIDVREVSRRKPLFMDESAHDWRLVRLGRELGWTGVALKTCKTQSGALLSACWAKRAGMALMVQDLTNPMIALIPHVSLAANVGTIMGVETNATQYYPDASAAEARVHPGLYRRRDGTVDLGSIVGPGFGYRIDEIDRRLPLAAYRSGRA